MLIATTLLSGPRRRNWGRISPTVRQHPNPRHGENSDEHQASRRRAPALPGCRPRRHGVPRGDGRGRSLRGHEGPDRADLEEDRRDPGGGRQPQVEAPLRHGLPGQHGDLQRDERRLGRLGGQGQHAGARHGGGAPGVAEVPGRDHVRRRPLGATVHKETAMREAVIVASSRTPLAKSFRGSFNLTRPDDLAAHCIRDVLGKVPQLDPTEVEDVILGCGQPHGAQGHNIARVAAVRAGLPVTVGGLTVNRFCSSGLQAIAIAANYIVNNGADVAIGGGVESITMMERDTSPNPWVKEHHPGIYMVMGDTAEVVAKRYKIRREAQDRYALQSQQRTARAQQEGLFKEALAPMHVPRGVPAKETGEIVGKEERSCDTDECNRPDTTLEGLLALPARLDMYSGQGAVHGGHVSHVSDGASATLVMSMERAKALGIRPKLVFRGFR